MISKKKFLSSNGLTVNKTKSLDYLDSENRINLSNKNQIFMYKFLFNINKIIPSHPKINVKYVICMKLMDVY